jgi:hypothetical protein
VLLPTVYGGPGLCPDLSTCVAEARALLAQALPPGDLECWGTHTCISPPPLEDLSVPELTCGVTLAQQGLLSTVPGPGHGWVQGSAFFLLALLRNQPLSTCCVQAPKQ